MVINVSTGKPFDVYVGRGSKWGNPFIIGIHGTRDEVIEKYERWIILQPQFADIHELYGKILGCHCHPKRCHGHSLERFAIAQYVPSFFE